jgi:hypothetical protein
LATKQFENKRRSFIEWSSVGRPEVRGHSPRRGSRKQRNPDRKLVNMRIAERHQKEMTLLGNISQEE